MTQFATDWVKPANAASGQDHLAVRTPCESLYAQLLPGITNVTDRARYYSFYPWFIWAYEKGVSSRDAGEFISLFRRADCLFSLIGMKHGGTDDKHANGLVGRNVLRRALEAIKNKHARLSKYTELEESEDRYFKNRMGGLGQYYLGTLRDLGVLSGDTRSGVRYTQERGVAIAEAFEKGVDRSRFFEVLRKDKATLEDLEALESFCPCYLHNNQPEQKALLELFSNKPNAAFFDEAATPRRWSIGVFLDFISQTEKLQLEYSLIDSFRACVYTGFLPNKAPWNLPGHLEECRKRWGTYQRNEMLSVAVQTVFWLGLRQFSEGIPMANSEALRVLFISSLSADAWKEDASQTFGAYVDSLRQSLPPLDGFDDEAHEVQLAWGLSWIQDSDAQLLRDAVQVLALLAARDGSEDDPYDGFWHQRGYFSVYPINLVSFRNYARSAWKDLSLRELAGWLVTRWGLETHLRVALRKLHGESLDTFRVRPTEEGLLLVNPDVRPVFSAPRLRQLEQILLDLGVIEDGKLTSVGKKLLQECHV